MATTPPPLYPRIGKFQLSIGRYETQLRLSMCPKYIFLTSQAETLMIAFEVINCSGVVEAL